MKKIMLILAVVLFSIFAAQASADQVIVGPKLDADMNFKGQLYVLHLKITAPRNQQEPGGWVRISTCGGTIPNYLHLTGTPWTKTKVLYWRFKSVPARSDGHLSKTFKFLLAQKSVSNGSTCLSLQEHIKGYQDKNNTFDLVTGVS